MIELTDEIIEQARSSYGGHSLMQMRVLGVTGFPEDWLEQCKRKTYTQKVINNLVNLKNEHLYESNDLGWTVADTFETKKESTGEVFTINCNSCDAPVQEIGLRWNNETEGWLCKKCVGQSTSKDLPAHIEWEFKPDIIINYR